MDTILSRENISASIQDYVKHAYKISQQSETITVSNLSRALSVSLPSTTNMIKRLIHLNLMKRSNRGKIALTEKGELLALEVIRHHRLLETFFIDILGMDWAHAHQEAEILEHYISERLEQLIDKKLAQPKHDPHGEPIPTRTGALKQKNLLNLLDAPIMEKFRIIEINSSQSEMLSYLQKQKLFPGTHLIISEVAPFEGPVKLEIGKQTQFIGQAAARCIFGEKIS